MFYEDDENVQVAEIGKGDILFCGGLTADLQNGTLSIVDNCGKCYPVGTPHDFSEMTPDTKLNTVMRLVFTRPELIDVIIAELNRAKQYMEDPKSHPWYKQMREQNSLIVRHTAAKALEEI